MDQPTRRSQHANDLPSRSRARGAGTTLWNARTYQHARWRQVRTPWSLLHYSGRPAFRSAFIKRSWSFGALLLVGGCDRVASGDLRSGLAHGQVVKPSRIGGAGAPAAGE